LTQSDERVRNAVVESDKLALLAIFILVETRIIRLPLYTGKDPKYI
jgi:hypothetical protein